MATCKFYSIPKTLLSSTFGNYDRHDRDESLLIRDFPEFDRQLNIEDFLDWIFEVERFLNIEKF